MNLAITVIAKLLHLSHNLSSGTAFFAAARKRNDAVRTKLVAALDDRHESHVRRSAIAGGNIPDVAFASLIQIDHSPLSIERLVDQTRQTICRARTDYEIDRRRAFEERLPFELRNTSHHTEDRRRADPFAADFPDTRKHFMRRSFTD